MWDDYHILLIAPFVFTNDIIRWYLPPQITICLINDKFNSFFFCLLDELILSFCYSSFDMENRWTHIRIDYHSSTTSEPTNQVCYSPQKNYKK